MAVMESFEDPNAEFRASRFFHRCMESQPGTFTSVLVAGSLALIATVALTLLQSRRLDRRPICLLRSYYHSILVFPVVWAISAYATLWCPLMAPVAELFQGQSEAYGIYVFLVVLYMLVSIEATQKEVASGADLRDTVPNMGQTIMQALEDEGPQKFFAVPPCGCCLYPCYKAHNITARQLLWVSRLVKQYVIVEVFLSVFFLWCRTTFPPKRAEPLNKCSRWILKVSGLVAMYGLVIMYKATHGLLHHWQTTRKFIAIKFVIFLSIVQGKIFTWLIEKFRNKEAPTSCLVDPAFPEDIEHVVVFWTQFATLLETTLMVVLISRAFTPDEVSDYPLKNLDLVELELRQMHAKQGSKDDFNSSSSEGECEEKGP